LNAGVADCFGIYVPVDDRLIDFLNCRLELSTALLASSAASLELKGYGVMDTCESSQP